MNKYEAKDLRNICLVGASHSGKTSLAEAILFNTKVTTRLGTVEQGTTVCDYNQDEKERKISISLALAFFEYEGKKINLIDTPGYADFIGEVIEGLYAADTAIIIVDALSGVDTNLENILEYVEKENLPVVIFINKMDKEFADFNKILNELKDKIGKNVTPLQIPIGKESDFCGVVDLIKKKELRFEQCSGKLKEELLSEALKGEAERFRDSMLESIASIDDSLIEKYLEGKPIEENEIIGKLKEGIIGKKIIPVICGSATKNIGIAPVLQLIADYLPSPCQREQEAEIKPDAPFSALVFKTVNEHHMGNLSLFKVYSGKICSGQDVYNFNKQTKERIGQLGFLQGNKRIEIEEVGTGDITCVAKLKVTVFGDILEEGKDSLVIRKPEFPLPFMNMAVYSKSKGDEEKIANALSSILKEDNTIKFYFDKDTREMILSGMGELQLEVIKSRVKSKYNVELEFKTPKIAYRETIRGKAEVQGKYKRQSGGKGQYGDCWLRIEALEKGQGFEFVNKIVGGAIPRNYIPSVEKGVHDALAEGVLAGYPLVDIRVTLYDGSYHEVDSSDMAFKIAGAMALRKGVKDAKPFMLEPIMEVSVIVPDEYMGAIMGDLNSKRGRVLGMEKINSKKEMVKANVPLGEMFRYAVDIRSLTKGSGTFRMSFSHYEEAPSVVSDPLIDYFVKSREEGR